MELPQPLLAHGLGAGSNREFSDSDVTVQTNFSSGGSWRRHQIVQCLQRWRT